MMLITLFWWYLLRYFFLFTFFLSAVVRWVYGKCPTVIHFFKWFTSLMVKYSIVTFWRAKNTMKNSCKISTLRFNKWWNITKSPVSQTIYTTCQSFDIAHGTIFPKSICQWTVIAKWLEPEILPISRCLIKMIYQRICCAL